MWPFSMKENRPVWRNSEGKIECPGDNCPQQKCDDTCPIWCNTMMITLGKIGHFDKAIESGEKAVNLAPDEAEFWNNLASMYGQNGAHRKAYDCYKKALDLRPNYPAALNGLKIAEGHLRSEKTEYNEEDVRDVIRIAHELPAEVYRLKLYPRPTLPFVPELMDNLNHVPHTLLDQLDEYYRKENNSTVFNNVTTAISWGFYAGIGAVTLWDRNWPELQKKGLLPILYESATIYDLDERVFHLAYGAITDAEFRMFHRKFNPLCLLILTKFSNDEIRANGEKTLLKMVQVAYLLGCAYRLHEIGMH